MSASTDPIAGHVVGLPSGGLPSSGAPSGGAPSGGDVPTPGDWPTLPERVRVVEVGPRDGLQNIDHTVPTDVKVAMIDRLTPLGFDRVEAVAFVHPRIVPQMADAEAVMERVSRTGAPLVGLVPNERGVVRAIACGLRQLNFVLSASESQNRSNLNQSISESLLELQRSMDVARSAGIAMRVTISTAFGCPFEGHVPMERVIDIALRVAEIGAFEICLGDTTGMANPRQVHATFVRLAEHDLAQPLAVHLHNTRGTGAANLIAALHAGVRIFDASMGGLGGCPFAPGATGNVSSEDMIHMLNMLGVETGVDLAGLVDAARALEPLIGVRLPGQVLRAGITYDGASATS